MNSKKVLIFLISLVVILTIILISFLSVSEAQKNNVIAYKEYNASVKIDNYIGINVDTDKLYFGTVANGDYGKRALNVVSSEEGYLYVTSQGSLEDYLFLLNKPEKIGAGESVSIDFVVAPKNMSLGEYDSVIRVFVLRKKSKFLRSLLIGKEIEIIKSDELKGISKPKISLEIPDIPEEKRPTIQN